MEPVPSPLHLFILPCSGGYFINQVAGLMLLFRASAGQRYQPHMAMGTSGGNITAYLAHGGQWTESGMKRLLHALSPRLFAVPWAESLFLRWIPTMAWGPLKGSFFGANQEGAPEAFFESTMDPARFHEVEVWTGTVNRTQFKPQLFCNRSHATSIVGQAKYPTHDTCLPPIYLDGNLRDVAQISLASASIPTVVPSVSFRGESYVDGGNAYASPFFPMQDRLREVLGEQGQIHLVRLNGYDPDQFYVDPRNGGDTGILRVGMNSVSYIQSCLNLHDRQAAIALVRMGGRPLEYQSGVVTRETLAALLERRDQMDRSLLEVLPDINNEVDILHFTPADLQKALDRVLAEGAMRYRFWYTPKQLIVV